MKNTALITGSYGGLGRCFFKLHAEKGGDLILVGRSSEKLEEQAKEVSKEYNVTAHTIAVDLSQQDAAQQIYDTCKENGWDVDIIINNAGFGDFGFMGNHDIQKMVKMIDLNVTALAILSSLFVRDYKCKQTQLINISSVGGYFLAPSVVPYCGTKFFVSAFTEGLYHELAQDVDAKMQAKILAPAATKSEFCDVASGKSGFDYDASFEKYHSSEQTADFLLTLYDSDACVGEVDLTSFEFKLSGPKFNYLAAAK